MEPKLVYRFEDENGKGPYRSTGPAHDRLSQRHNGHPQRPIPFQETSGKAANKAFDLLLSRDGRTGMASPEELAAWFEGFVPMLLEHGYRMRCYEAQTYYVDPSNSSKQIVFDIRLARMIVVSPSFARKVAV